MKTIKSYSKIWSAEGTLYSVGDTNLPFPVTYSQILYFVIGFVFMFIFSDIPPFSMIDNWLIKFIAIPAIIAFLLNKVDFDGKRPQEFIISNVSYLFRPKMTYGGFPIRRKKLHRTHENITVRYVR